MELDAYPGLGVPGSPIPLNFYERCNIVNDSSAGSRSTRRQHLASSLAIDLALQVVSGAIVAVPIVTLIYVTHIRSIIPGGSAGSFSLDLARAAGTVFLFSIPSDWSSANRQRYRERYHELCFGQFECDVTARRCLKIVMSTLMLSSPVLAIVLISISGGWYIN